MSFKDLESIRVGTILVDNVGVDRRFMGFSLIGEFIITTEPFSYGNAQRWSETSIEDWKIKKE